MQFEYIICALGFSDTFINTLWEGWADQTKGIAFLFVEPENLVMGRQPFSNKKSISYIEGNEHEDGNYDNL